MLETGPVKWSQEILLDISPLPPLSIQTEVFDVPGVFPTWVLHLGAPEMPPGTFVFASPKIPARDQVELAFYNATEAVVYPGTQAIRLVSF